MQPKAMCWAIALLTALAFNSSASAQMADAQSDDPAVLARVIKENCDFLEKQKKRLLELDEKRSVAKLYIGVLDKNLKQTSQPKSFSMTWPPKGGVTVTMTYTPAQYSQIKGRLEKWKKRLVAINKMAGYAADSGASSGKVKATAKKNLAKYQKTYKSESSGNTAASGHISGPLLRQREQVTADINEADRHAQGQAKSLDQGHAEADALEKDVGKTVAELKTR